MGSETNFERPSFEEAVAEWTRVLTQYSLPTDLVWILDENLCFERDKATQKGMRVAFQTRFTPQPADAAQRAYEFFSECEARIVFYRVGTCRGQSVCMILCDPVFDSRGPDEGFVRRDDWGISFNVGGSEEIEEVTEEDRWKDRIVRGRPLSDLDFCMPMDVLRELDAHGRPLSSYERFGVRILDAWQRWDKRDS